jgi:hypothetical protein
MIRPRRYKGKHRPGSVVPRLSYRDAVRRSTGLSLVLFLLFLLPMGLVGLATSADHTAHSIRATIAGPAFHADRLVVPCSVEDATSGPLPCLWDARVRGNGDPGYLVPEHGLTGVVFFPGSVDEQGAPVACFGVTSGSRFICEDGVEW